MWKRGGGGGSAAPKMNHYGGRSKPYTLLEQQLITKARALPAFNLHASYASNDFTTPLDTNLCPKLSPQYPQNG